MQSTGLLEVWTESNLMGQKTDENVMAGKYFPKAVRAHKITSYALWQIILPQLLNFIQNEDIAMKNILENAEDYDALLGFSQKINSATYYHILSTVIAQISTLCCGRIIFRW